MSVYTPNLSTFNTDGSRMNPSTSSHQDSQKLLPKNIEPQDPLDKTYAITPHRLRSQLFVNNLKASGILPHQADEIGRPPPLKHSARGLEAIGFDESASMYSSYKGEGERERRVWKDDGGGKEKKVGGKRRFLKKLVGKGEEKGEKL